MDLPLKLLNYRLLAMCLALAAAVVLAGQPPQRGQGTKKPIDKLPSVDKRWAIVIGIDDYRDPNITDLSGAVNDAKALSTALQQYAGFREANIILLASDQPDERQPTLVKILKFLGNFYKAIPADGMLLMAFSGHGIERGGKSFLLPANAEYSENPRILEKTSLEVEYLKEMIRETGARQVFMIVDACRNDPAAGRSLTNNALSERFSNSFDFNTRNREVDAFITLYATSIGQRSYEYSEKRQGFFTWALIEGLKGKAANERGEVTLGTLMEYLDETVPNLVRIHTGQVQVPRVSMDGFKGNQLVLAYAPKTDRLASAVPPRPVEPPKPQPVVLPELRWLNVKLTNFFRPAWLTGVPFAPRYGETVNPPPAPPVLLPQINQMGVALVSRLPDMASWNPPALRLTASLDAGSASPAPPKKLVPVQLPAIQRTARLVVSFTRPPYTLVAPKFSLQPLEIPPAPAVVRNSRPRPGVPANSPAVATLPDNTLTEPKVNPRPRPPAEDKPVVVTAPPAATLPATDTGAAPPSKESVPAPNAVAKASVALIPMRAETAEVDAGGKIKNRRAVESQGFIEMLGNDVKLEMVLITGGKFLMGAPANQKGAYPDEKPQHEVTVADFAMSRFEITQAQWRVVASLPKVQFDLPLNPARFKGDFLPVEQVSWVEAWEFCARLTIATGKSYALPTEAQWEYACRASSSTPYSFGETITVDLVNYDGQPKRELAKSGNYRGKTVSVGSLGLANRFGLFDMHGNVAEWCLDEWHDNYAVAPADDRMWGSLDGSYCVVRGGSWFDGGAKSVSYHRDRYLKQMKSHSIGFRVSLKLEQ